MCSIGCFLEGSAFGVVFILSLKTPPESGTILKLRFIPTNRHVNLREITTQGPAIEVGSITWAGHKCIGHGKFPKR
jgi:hypothetical protein